MRWETLTNRLAKESSTKDVSSLHSNGVIVVVNYVMIVVLNHPRIVAKVPPVNSKSEMTTSDLHDASVDEEGGKCLKSLESNRTWLVMALPSELAVNAPLPWTPSAPVVVMAQSAAHDRVNPVTAISRLTCWSLGRDGVNSKSTMEMDPHFSCVK